MAAAPQCPDDSDARESQSPGLAELQLAQLQSRRHSKCVRPPGGQQTRVPGHFLGQVMRTTLNSPRGILGRAWLAGEGTLGPRIPWMCGWTDAIDRLDSLQREWGTLSPLGFPHLGLQQSLREFFWGRPPRQRCGCPVTLAGGPLASALLLPPLFVGCGFCTRKQGSSPWEMRQGTSVTCRKRSSWTLTCHGRILLHWL